MQELQLEVRVSVNGEPYRVIANGIRLPEGKILLFGGSLPAEVEQKFTEYLEDFEGAANGTVLIDVGQDIYQLACKRTL